MFTPFRVQVFAFVVVQERFAFPWKGTLEVLVFKVTTAEFAGLTVIFITFVVLPPALFLHTNVCVEFVVMFLISLVLVITTGVPFNVQLCVVPDDFQSRRTLPL